jgi:molybdenum cofactor synthesis domain-containing protein
MLRAVVITCSDSAVDGTRRDASGPAVAAILRASGYEVIATMVVADEVDSIAAAIVEAVDQRGAALVVTTGGTGIAPRDVTPEATARVIDRHITGFGELMRAASAGKTPMAWLSRAGAGSRGKALVVNLPGSVAGATENLEAVLQLIPHALELLSGRRVEKHPDSKG